VVGRTSNESTFPGPVHVEAAIAALARAQHRVASLEQLTLLGLSPAAVQYRARIGRFERWAQGVYVLGAGPLTVDGVRRAAVFAAGQGAVLSHRSAAAAWGLVNGGPTKEHVTVEGRGRELARVKVHGANRLDAADVTEVRDIPITTVARTIVDLAGDPCLERVFHEAEVAQLLDVVGCRAALSRVRGRLHLDRVEALIADPAADVTHSALEDRFGALCDPAGLPTRRTNQVIDLGDRLITVDVLFPAERVVVELDGERYHRTRRTFHTDRERDAALAALGYVVVRLTWRRVTRDGPAVVAQLRRILATRR
jgi:hypothetical protein